MANLLTEPFTGTNGDPWNSTNWASQSGSTIQGNKGRLESPALAYQAGSVSVAAAILSGQGGDFDLYFEATVGTLNADEILIVRCNVNGGDWVDIWNLCGSDAVWIRESNGYSGTNRATAALTIAQGDVLKNRIIKNGSTISVYAWTTGSQPGTPTCTYTNATIGALTTDNIQLRAENDNDTTAAYFDFDNLTIDTLGAGATTVTAQVATLDLVAVAITPTPGAVTVTAQVATLDLVAVPGALTSSVTITAQVATLDLSGVAGTITTGNVTVTAQVATLALSGQQGVITSGGVQSAQVGTLSLTGVAGVITVGAVTVTAQVAVLPLTGVAITPTAGAVTVIAQPGSLALTAVPGTLSSVVTIAAQAAVATLLAVPGTVSVGAVSTAAQPAELDLSGMPGTVSGGPYTVLAQVALALLTAVQGTITARGPLVGGHGTASVGARDSASVSVILLHASGASVTQPSTAVATVSET